MLPLVTDANTASSKLDDAVATSGKVVQNIAMRQKAVDNEIRNCFKKLHDALKDRERSLLALSSQVGAGKTTALKMQSEEMKSLNDKITQVSRLMTEASDSYTPAEMLSAKNLLTDKLDSLMKQYKACSLTPARTSRYTLTSTITPSWKRLRTLVSLSRAAMLTRAQLRCTFHGPSTARRRGSLSSRGTSVGICSRGEAM